MSREDKRWMRRCQRLARLAARRGNAAVGAVVVRAGRLIAQGQERVSSERNVAGHAELEAIQQSCRILGSLNLSECTLYTTTEPCWMCAFGIRETGIVRVVIGRLEVSPACRRRGGRLVRSAAYRLAVRTVRR